MVDVKIDDLSDGNVIALLKEHRQEMLQFCPCDSVHALDENTMRDETPDIFSRGMRRSIRRLWRDPRPGQRTR